MTQRRVPEESAVPVKRNPRRAFLYSPSFTGASRFGGTLYFAWQGQQMTYPSQVLYDDVNQDLVYDAINAWRRVSGIPSQTVTFNYATDAWVDMVGIKGGSGFIGIGYADQREIRIDGKTITNAPPAGGGDFGDIIYLDVATYSPVIEFYSPETFQSAAIAPLAPRTVVGTDGKVLWPPGLEGRTIATDVPE